MVTVGDLPVLTEVYPGNQGDAKVFAGGFDTLGKRLIDREVATRRLIVVFDRGINSTDSFAGVRGAMHIIAALIRVQPRRLFPTLLADFQEVAQDSEGRSVLGYPTHWFVFEQEGQVLVTYRKQLDEHEEVTWGDARPGSSPRSKSGGKSPRRRRTCCGDDSPS